MIVKRKLIGIKILLYEHYEQTRKAGRMKKCLKKLAETIRN